MPVCSACPLHLSFCKEQSPPRADKRHMKQSCHHCCTQSRHNQSTTVLRYFSVTLCRQPLGTAMGPPLAQPPLSNRRFSSSRKAKTRSQVCCSQSTAVPYSSQLGSNPQGCPYASVHGLPSNTACLPNSTLCLTFSTKHLLRVVSVYGSLFSVP